MSISRMMLILGILFTILSVFISYYVINQTNNKVDSYRKEISMYEDNIDQLWKRKQELEQRHAISIMLYALVSDKNKSDPVRIAADHYVQDTISYHEIEVSTDSYNGIKLLPGKLQNIQEETINDINNIYVQKLTKESAMMELQRTSDTYKVIGLLLQVIGLILVLYFKP